MLIKRTSVLTGEERTRDIPVTQEEYNNYMLGNQPIQVALSFLTKSDREFLISGITEEEWDEVFQDDEEFNEMKGQ